MLDRRCLIFFFFSLSPSQVGTAGGWSVVRSRVQSGKEGLLTLCRWAGAVVCSAPNGVAGQLSRSLSGRLSCRLGLPRASQGQNQVRARPEVQVQVSSGAANRIGSDRGGSDGTGVRTLSRPSIRVTSSGAAVGCLVISSLGISMEPGESQASTLSDRVLHRVHDVCLGRVPLWLQ